MEELLRILEENAKYLEDMGHVLRDEGPKEDGKKMRWLVSHLSSLIADSARLDWLEAWRSGDVIICPPGNHGGAETNWLVGREDDERHDSYGTLAYEHEGPSLRDAIDAAVRATPHTGARHDNGH